MKLRLKQGGIVKLQNAAETIPTFIVADPMSQMISQNNDLAQIMERDAAKAEWKRKVEAAEKKADERINNEDNNLASQFMFSGETGEWSRGANTNARRAKYVAEELGLDGNKAFLDSYKKDGKTGAIAFGTTLLTAPMAGEFATYGLLGGAARLAGGMAGSAIGSWGLGKVGDWADNRLGTNWIGTTGRIVGGFAGWGPGSNFAYKGALDLASKAPSIARIGATDRFAGDVARKALGRSVNSTSFIPAQVKYYGPTMGKSYAAKTNPNLIDLDTWGRAEYDQLAKKYGYKDWREMILSDKGDYNAEYKQLIQDQIRRIQSDPKYSGKTIVVSNASLLKPNSGIAFANTPAIPERSIMATRNNVRHPWESIEHGEGWWDSLQEKGTPLRIDNRFVSEIEGNKIASVPKSTPDYTQIATTYHFDPRVKLLSRPISKTEKKGIIKSERPFYDTKVLDTAKLFAKEYGYPEPTTIEEIKNMYRRHNTFFRSVNDIQDNGYNTKLYNSLPEWYRKLSIEEQRKILASKGYPLAFRTGSPSDKFMDQFVFVSPSLEENARYFKDGNLDRTIKLQRPFSFRDPKRWFIDADWRPYPAEYLNEQHHGSEIWPKGHTEVGNASPAQELKISTDKLIPVDVAKSTDKGTLLGDYFVKRINGDEFHHIPYDRYRRTIIYRNIYPEYDIAPEYSLEYLMPERHSTREYPVFPELQDDYILKYLQSQGFKLPIKKTRWKPKDKIQ